MTLFFGVDTLLESALFLLTLRVCAVGMQRYVGRLLGRLWEQI